MKKFNWLVLGVLFAFFASVGCSGMAPNQIAPNQTVGLNGANYCFEEDVEMDLCDTKMTFNQIAPAPAVGSTEGNYCFEEDVEMDLCH